MLAKLKWLVYDDVLHIGAVGALGALVYLKLKGYI